jgi:hypothetical protein
MRVSPGSDPGRPTPPRSRDIPAHPSSPPTNALSPPLKTKSFPPSPFHQQRRGRGENTQTPARPPIDPTLQGRRSRPGRSAATARPLRGGAPPRAGLHVAWAVGVGGGASSTRSWRRGGRSGCVAEPEQRRDGVGGGEPLGADGMDAAGGSAGRWTRQGPGGRGLRSSRHMATMPDQEPARCGRWIAA